MEADGRRLMGSIKIGTCSWKYPSWKGLVYFAAKGIDYLAEYSQRYETVEIDQWFWSLFDGYPPKLPRREDADDYRRSVDDRFRFTVKVPNSLTLTHYYSKRGSGPPRENPHFLSPALWSEFTDAIAALDDAVGLFMLQFEYLNRSKMKSQKEFLGRLGRFFESIPAPARCAVEVRNSAYLNATFFDFLADHGAAPVLLEGYWMPPVVDIYRRWRNEIIAHDAVVIRLHGGDRKGMEERTKKKWNAIVEPMDNDLDAIASMVRDLADNDVRVYVNVNNHYEGSAPLTIEKLSSMMGI